MSPGGRPVCECKPGHSRNRLTGRCNWVDRQCGGDADCAAGERCVEGVHHVGVRTCEDACVGIACGSGAECVVARAHVGACRCANGFAGKPGERSGCSPVNKDDCQNDAQCDESQVGTIYKSRPVWPPFFINLFFYYVHLVHSELTFLPLLRFARVIRVAAVAYQPAASLNVALAPSAWPGTTWESASVRPGDFSREILTEADAR